MVGKVIVITGDEIENTKIARDKQIVCMQMYKKRHISLMISLVNVDLVFSSKQLTLLDNKQELLADLTLE